MNSHADILQSIIDKSRALGTDEVLCECQDNTIQEMTFQNGELNLLRSVTDRRMGTTAIIAGAKGGSSGSGINPETAERLVNQSVELACNSEPDDANGIAPYHPAHRFSRGPLTGDLDIMSSRFLEFLDSCSQSYPNIHLEFSYISYHNSINSVRNSNGVDFQGNYGLYEFRILVANVKDRVSGSFNYSGFITANLDRPLIDGGSIKLILEQENRTDEADSSDDSHAGTVLITPDCLIPFLYDLTYQLGNYPMISTTSIFKEKLDTIVAAPEFTLSCYPVSDNLAAGSFFTHDGFLEKNLKIIDEGVLKTYLVDLYGSRKTGLTRASTYGNFHVVEAGSDSLESLIAGIDKGILLTRFSGSTSSTGDFSGIAKNSYRIQDGKVGGRLSETMVSGNLKDLFKNIRGISLERINFGHSILPWICSEGLTISKS